MRFGMVVFSASVTEKMGESVNRDEANYAGPLNREKNRNVHNLGPTNRKPRACSAVNSKENSDLFPFPLHPSTLCTLNSPHPRDVTSPTLESFFCQSVGSTRRWRIYIYIYTVAQRSAGQIAFGTEHWPGQREALRENDSRCRSPVNQPFPPPFPFFHFLFFSPLCPFYVP